ncbi:MAG: M36 family metallopeptidase [Flavobacteriales bacterium]|nr:M36 family metallopeptidase [Flavobacteriales bacterium]
MRSILTLCVALSSLLVAAQRPGAPSPKVMDELMRQGFHGSDLEGLLTKDHYADAGITHTFFRQRWQGIEVWNGDIAVHELANGEPLRLNVGAFTALEKRVNATEPEISADDAVGIVLARTLPGSKIPALISIEDEGRRVVFEGDGLGHEPVIAQLVYQPVGDRLHLAWNVNHYTPDGSHWWNVRIDALTGEELDRNDWVASCNWDDETHYGCDEHAPDAAPAPAAPNDYNVFDWPTESPSHGPRTLSNAPWLDGGIASPYGWHDTNGAAGAEYTDTRGNNCFAQEDADANNTGGTRPSGGAGLDFDFPLDLTGAPSTYLPAATANLFYWNNLMHDVWYQYGFTDPAGNFQENNYGRGGAGSDPVDADAQDGSGTNNANFGTPPDGSNPRMQMYRWTSTTPNRDSDLDNGIIAHEYGHGISNRLVGGPSNTSCLGNPEQMGEGWSDYFGIVMTMKATDTPTTGRGVGTYVLGQATTGVGIRPARYTTSFASNNYTYASTNSGLSQPHGIGFVWCTMLWEMTWELIGVHGFDPDIYNGDGGNNIAMRLVIEGLKLTPCNPGFVDGRDAILAADQALYGGANQAAIWAAFARRGLGASASQGLSTSRSDQVEAFDTPLPSNLGISEVLSPRGDLYDCATTNMPVTVTVRNFGQQPQTDFELRYQLNGGTEEIATYVGTLAAGASANFTFPQPVTIPGTGPHTLTARTNLAGDQYTANDQAASAITVSTPTTLPSTYVENIEATSPVPTGWALQNPDNGNTWVTKAVSGQASCVGARTWAIDNYSVSTPGQEDRLITPRIDLSGSAGTRLKYKHAYSGYSSSYPDGMRVQVSGDCGLSWTTVFEAFGAALQTNPYVTSSWTPTTCTQWQQHDHDLTAFDGGQVLVRFVAINNYGNWLYLDDVVIERNGVRVAVKLMLDGPYDEGTDRMSDGLRAGGLLPTTEPYSAAGFTQVFGGGESIDPAAMATTGDDAIVDWVLLELRDAAAPATIIATRAALLQRDGDVVDTDLGGSVTFRATGGSYHVAVRHRNHLGAMTAAPTVLSTTPTGIDFTVPGTATFGTEAQRLRNGRTMLWSGDVLRDGILRYTGEDNDRDPLLVAIGGSVPTNVSAPGYLQGDVNLDGVIRYTGEGNDRDPILVNIGGSVPTNTREQQLP